MVVFERLLEVLRGRQRVGSVDEGVWKVERERVRVRREEEGGGKGGRGGQRKREIDVDIIALHNACARYMCASL